MCGNVYQKGWTAEEAEKECVENFGENMAHGDDEATVCDDCYQKIKPEEHPFELMMAKREFDIEALEKAVKEEDREAICFLIAPNMGIDDAIDLLPKDIREKWNELEEKGIKILTT